MHRFLLFAAMAALLVMANSCQKDDIIIEEPDPDTTNNEQPVEETSKDFIYDIFKENYLWIEELPGIAPNDYSSNELLVDALRYDEIDHWSFVSDLQEYRNLFDEAETKGFGVGMAITQDDKLMVRFTYKNAPMGLAGVDRGWEFIKINDVDVSDIPDLWAAFDTDGEVKFTFRTVSNDTVEYSMTRTDYEINTVLHKCVVEDNGKKIGYLVFESFLGPSAEELDDAFDYFNQQEVDDIVVDLRYNGGGNVDIAFQLMELLGGNAIINKVITSIVYNSNRTDENDSYGFGRGSGKAVELDRLYFITTESSASASELVINSLFPYKEITIIGERTHGKPVGMEVYESEKYQIALAPVTFKLVNALGDGDYFSGIPVDYEEADDIFHSWGDPNEACLKKALEVISGETSMVAAKSATIQPKPLPLKRGLQEITGAY
ncbi:S41 family peptidase [Sunxiuqinia sp. A32]|uniref:S41 family peptidase n=1 Tax=Sunxiuqinia sp. A32 TaxID=3461496 RepID=UPI004045BF38